MVNNVMMEIWKLKMDALNVNIPVKVNVYLVKQDTVSYVKRRKVGISNHKEYVLVFVEMQLLLAMNNVMMVMM